MRKVRKNKAPHPDSIPNEALKQANAENAQPFLYVYNNCLHDRVFPKTWRKQKLVLLLKPEKPVVKLESCRQLRINDVLGKMWRQSFADADVLWRVSDRYFGGW